MTEFLKMDIFFFVTTIAVAVVSIVLVVVLIRVLRILKNVEDISVMVEEEGQKLREDIGHVRAKVAEEGLRVSHMLDFLGVVKPKKSRKKS